MTKATHFFIRATALIFLWRGAWHLMDMWLFPSNPLYSNVASLIIGAVLIVFADTILWPGMQESPTSPAQEVKDDECAPQE